ncbi:MAG: ADP-ribosyltransferase domain-containing protein [bacterium]|nr:ADP-ribosyltransferase domain-containing protein [bacterium]
MNIGTNFGFIQNSGITQAYSAPSMPSSSPAIEEAPAEIQDGFSMSSGIDEAPNMPSGLKKAMTTEEAGFQIVSSAETAGLHPVTENIQTIESIIPAISSSSATAADTAGAAGSIKEFLHPGTITPDADTKAMTEAFGALTAITGGLSEKDASALLQKSGERNLNETLDDMKDLRYMQRSAVKNSGMTLAEKTALFAYTGDAYAPLNTALRTHDTEKVSKMQPLIDNTVAALDKLPPYKGTTVYRGAEMPQAFFDEHKPGAKVTYSAFTSTSTKALPGFKGNTALTIDCAGDRGRGKDIKEFSKFEYESEILFPPDSEFIVISHTVKDGKHFIHMKEVPKQA